MPRTVASIRILPARVQLTAVGDTARYAAVGVDGAGHSLPGTVSATWKVTDPSIAVSLGDGRFRALGAG